MTFIDEELEYMLVQRECQACLRVVIEISDLPNIC